MNAIILVTQAIVKYQIIFSYEYFSSRNANLVSVSLSAG